MKKILICAIAFSLLCAVAVGCAKRPQSSETDSSSVTSSQANDSSSTRVVDEFDPVKEVVENFFNDYKGYWLNSAGEYVLFKTEEDGSCILEKYSSDGKLMSTREIIEIAATNKTSYAAKSADSKVFTFEIAESYDGVIGIHESDGDVVTKYVFAGKTADDMKANYKESINRAASK